VNRRSDILSNVTYEERTAVIDADVVVAGAGFAGLVAARELAEGGLDTVVVEARDRWGGRAWSKPDALEGRTLEMGANWLEPDAYWRIYNELQRYGISIGGAPAAYGLPAKWHLLGELREGGLPFDWKGMVDVERALVHIAKAAARIDSSRPLSEQDLDDLDVTLDEFFEPLGLDPYMHEMAVTQLAQSSTANTRESTALHPLRLVASAGTVYTYLGGGSDVIVPSIGALQDAIAADAQGSGARFHFERPVRRVVQDGDGVTVECDGETYRARAVVLALSSAAYANVAIEPETPLRQAMIERSGPDGDWSEGGKFWAILTDLPADASGAGTTLVRYFGVWEDLGDGRYLAVGFTKGHDPIDPDDRDQVEAALREFYPDVKVEQVIGQNWLHDEWTGATWPGFPVGWIKKYEQQLLEPQGRLVFAGSDIAIQWPTCMEGGIESGQHAAGLVRELLA
jgi:monoamine oxidase